MNDRTQTEPSPDSFPGLEESRRFIESGSDLRGLAAWENGPVEAFSPSPSISTRDVIVPH